MSGDTPPEPFELPPEMVSSGSADLRDSDSDSAPIRCNHPGCSNPVVRTGRGGRPPKYCPEHKNQKSAPKGPNNRSSTSGKNWPRATEVESILTQYIGGLGYAIQLVNPADGKVIADGGPAVVHELVELAKDDLRLRKVLEPLATPGRYGPLGLAVLAVVMPIMANHGLLPQIRIPGVTQDDESSPGLRAV